MPNWTRNVVTVPAETWEKFVERVITVDEDGQRFDFSKIVPLPEKDLSIDSGSGSYIMDNKMNRALRGEELMFTINVLNPYFAQFYTDDITQDDFYNKAIADLLNNKVILDSIRTNLHFPEDEKNFNQLIRGYFNVRRHGVVDWYEAQIQAWGTKWNAHETYIDEQHCQISFDTAWNTPVPIWSKLGEDFNFVFAFADEDRGGGYGVIEVKDGHAIPLLERIEYKDDKIGCLVLNELCHGYDVDGILESYSEEEIEEFYEMSAEEFEKKVSEYFDDAYKKVGQYV